MNWILAIISLVVIAKSVQANELKDVVVKETDQGVSIRYLFTEPVGAESVKMDFINQTVQLEIPNVSQNSPSKTERIDSAKVKSVYTYKVANGLRSRVIYKKPVVVSDFRENVRLSQDGSALVVEIPFQSRTVNMPKILPQDIEGIVAGSSNSLELDSDKVLANEFKSAADSALPKAAIEEKRTEKEIPAFKSSVAAVKKEQHPYARMMISLGVIAAFGIAMVVVGKWWAKNKKKDLTNTKIALMTQFHLGPKKSLGIVRVAGEFILIGITDQNINLIKTLSLIDDEYPTNGTNKSFDSAMTEFSSVANEEWMEAPPIKSSKSNQHKSGESHAHQPKNQESVSFALNNIKDRVSGRLKDMRRI